MRRASSGWPPACRGRSPTRSGRASTRRPRRARSGSPGCSVRTASGSRSSSTGSPRSGWSPKGCCGSGRAGYRRGGDERRPLSPPRRRRVARRAARDRHRQRPRRPQALPLHGPGIVRQVRSGDEGALPRSSRDPGEHRAGGGPGRVRLREALLPPQLPPPRRVRHRRSAAGAPRARGSRASLRHPAPAGGGGAAGLRARRHQQGRLRRLLPDRAGLHRGRPGAGNPGRPRPRLGGRLDRGVRARDHQRLSADVRPAVRAVPEPGAGVDAGHRRRLLLRAPGRGDRVRPPALRPRQRRADRHLRHHEGARGAQGRGPGAPDPAGRGRPTHQAGAVGAGL